MASATDNPNAVVNAGSSSGSRTVSRTPWACAGSMTPRRCPAPSRRPSPRSWRSWRGSTMTTIWGGPVRAGVPDDGAVPEYYLAKIEILALVDSLGEDAAVPSERELAARLGMARETVRQALRDLLVEAGSGAATGGRRSSPGRRSCSRCRSSRTPRVSASKVANPVGHWSASTPNRRMRRSPATSRRSPARPCCTSSASCCRTASRWAWRAPTCPPSNSPDCTSSSIPAPRCTPTSAAPV